ncbi:hypothetical protein ACJ73_01186 [Blastomyces percursus]|uniref:Nucleolar protein Dnt1-like N-terminal domain-containing protein n=1 Tax=Blastomyces percursus TaxID=1658174 RepID=A0A1J9RHE2_9EURO|nr:hypothetical protein ACJ73_01186 [Blastomyces percursus]
MVLLRLTVKVYPREQLGRPSTPGQAGDNEDRNPINFLLPVHQPERVILGNLAHMIREKWMTLQPSAGPLEIKKLVDDKHPEDTLDAALTVADVFVDNGKALADGLDQRGAVRVIQRPGRAERYGSVVQDWGAIASKYARPAPPLFSDPLRSEDRPIHTGFTGGPIAGPLHAMQVPESDYARQSSEVGEEVSSTHDNHTHASPILVEDSQKPRIFVSSSGKSLDLRNHERTTSKELGGSVITTQEEDIGYGGTIHDALKYTNAKDEAAMREMERQEFLRANIAPPRTSVPLQSSDPSHKLRSTSSTYNNSHAAAPHKREAEAVDIYTIPSTSQEEFKKPQKPRSTKRQRRNISRADEFTVKTNMETLLASPGDRANNAIIVDSDIGEDKLTGQAHSPRDGNVATENQSCIRRGTRKSNIRGPGRISLALKTAILPPANAKTSTPDSTGTTKAPAKNRISVVIADSDVDRLQQHTQKTSGGHRGAASQPSGGEVYGGNKDERDHNAPTGANGTNFARSGSTQRPNACQLEHVDAENSNPIYSDISGSDVPDDVGASSSGAQKNTQVATPQKTIQKPAPSPVERRQIPGSGSGCYSQTHNSIGTLELTSDPDNIPEKLSHSSPSRSRGAQELEQGITSPPRKISRTPSMSQPAVATDAKGNTRSGVSTTPAFPRPRRGSHSQTERRGSLLKSEKSSTGDPRTPVMSALRSAQKSTPRTVSTRRSVSLVDDVKADSQPASSSASSVKIGNTMYPPGTTVEWVEWQRTDAKLQKRIDEARLQGKSEDYLVLLEEVKHFTERLYNANSKKIGFQITKYERKLKNAKENLQDHPEEDHHAESSSRADLGNNDSREDENGKRSKNHTDATGTPKGTGKKFQHQTGLDGTSEEESQDEKPHAKQPSDEPVPRDSLVCPSLETPSTDNFVVVTSPSPGRMDNGISGENVEEAKTFKDGNGLKRKRPESGTVESPDNTKRIRSDYKPRAVEPEREPNNMNTNSPEQEPSEEPRQRNGKSPARDPMSSSDSSSSSDSDNNSEFDSNLTPANGKVGKRPSLPPPGGSARRTLITPFRSINKTWPNKGAQWLSDEPENTHTTTATAPTGAAAGFGVPTSFSQPAPSSTGTGGASNLRTPRMTMNGGARGLPRDTLKTLLERQKGSEDEGIAKNMSPSENGDSTQGGDGSGSKGFQGLNGFLRMARIR